MIALLAAALLGAAPPSWEFVGTTNSDLRVFVDRDSIADAAGLRLVSVQLGSARAIVRQIVKIVQTDEIDCVGDRWRLLDFRAYDAADAVVAQRAAPIPPMPLVPVAAGSLGATLRDAVCGPARGRAPG